MTERLLRADEQIVAGLEPSSPLDSKVLWADGRNVVFKEHSVQPIPGEALLVSKLEVAPGRGALELLVNGVPTLFWGTPKKLYRFKEGGAAEDVSNSGIGGGSYGGIIDSTATQAATRWSFVSWGIWAVASNGVDPVQINKDAAEFVDLGGISGVFSTAEIVRTFGPYLIALNTDNDPAEFSWCDTDDVETWTPSAINAAGSLLMRDLNSPIIAAEDLSTGGIGVYGSNQLHLIQFVGPPNYFGQRHLLSGIGAVSKDSVVPVEGLHLGMGPRGFFMTDGIQPRAIDDPKIHDFVYNSLNRDQISKVVGWDEPNLGITFWSYPQLGFSENNITVGFNRRNGSWGIYDFVRTAATSGSIFDFAVSIDASGNVFFRQIEGFTPDLAQKLVLPASAGFVSGYGQGGYGQGGYSGSWATDG